MLEGKWLDTYELAASLERLKKEVGELRRQIEDSNGRSPKGNRLIGVAIAVLSACLITLATMVLLHPSAPGHPISLERIEENRRSMSSLESRVFRNLDENQRDIEDIKKATYVLLALRGVDPKDIGREARRLGVEDDDR